MLTSRFQLVNSGKHTLKYGSASWLCVSPGMPPGTPITVVSPRSCLPLRRQDRSVYTSGFSAITVNTISILALLFSSASISVKFELFPALKTVFTGKGALLYMYSDLNYRITIHSWSWLPVLICYLKRQLANSISGFERSSILPYIWHTPLVLVALCHIGVSRLSLSFFIWTSISSDHSMIATRRTSWLHLAIRLEVPWKLTTFGITATLLNCVNRSNLL